MISCGFPPRKLGWSKHNKFFGKRKKGPHGWHAHPRRKRLTARRKPQARELNRQYREFGKKVCKEAWRRDAVSQPVSKVAARGSPGSQIKVESRRVR